MKLWDKQKTLEEKFEEEKDSHLKAQVAQEDQLLPVKSEPAKKKIKAEAVPTVMRDLFYGTPLSSSSSASCSSSSSDQAPLGSTPRIWITNAERFNPQRPLEMKLLELSRVDTFYFQK